MTKTISPLSFSTIRKEIRLTLQSRMPRPVCPVNLPDFLPAGLKIWTGRDSDHFHRAFCHHRMILKVILSGNASTCMDGVRYRLSAGDAVLYFPMQAHSTETDDQDRYEYLAISFVRGSGNYEALQFLRDHVFTPDPENRFLLPMIRAWNQGDAVHAAYLLAEMLARAAGHAEGCIPNGDAFFLAVSDYIRKHCREALSVKTIADAFQVSPQTLRRIFRRNISGLGPGELLRQQRITYAEELLYSTELAIAEIAVRCGFSSAVSFSRAFKNMRGFPPQACRKQAVGTAAGAAGASAPWRSGNCG